MTALSNMPTIDAASDDNDPHWVTDTFATSVKMSTYLVAFTVTNFESLSRGRVSVLQARQKLCVELRNKKH